MTVGLRRCTITNSDPYSDRPTTTDYALAGSFEKKKETHSGAAIWPLKTAEPPSPTNLTQLISPG